MERNFTPSPGDHSITRPILIDETIYGLCRGSDMQDDVGFDFLINYDRRIATMISATEVNEAFRKYGAIDNMVWSAGVGSQ